MDYFAHSGRLADRSDWQALRDHLYETAELAASFAVRFGLEKAAFTAGLFHDLGKYAEAFQKRLNGAEIRVDHSTAGAVVLRDRTSGMDADVAQLIVYAILGHHAGLPDKQNEFGHCVRRRLEEFQGRLDPIWEREIKADLTGLMPPELLRKFSARKSREDACFDLSVVTRFLFSCLVDADFRNTEAYYAKLEGLQPDREWPLLQDLLPDFTARFDAHMAKLASDSDLGRLRGKILAHVRSGARMEPGFFTLNVPTGGGKTLASLGFALAHARLHGHSRIIYAIPFNSIRYKFPPEDIRAAFELLDRVGLEGYENRRADALSGGQRQRVGIARALMQRPELLLLDEPTASLDPKTSRQIMRLVGELVNERKTPAIINIHDVALAKAHADRIIGFNDGRIVFDDVPANLTDEALARIYGDEDWNPPADDGEATRS